MDPSFNQLLSSYYGTQQPNQNLLLQGNPGLLDLVASKNNNAGVSNDLLLEQMRQRMREQNLRAFARKGGGLEEWQGMGPSDISPFSMDEFRNRGYDIEYLRSFLMRRPQGSLGV